MAKVSMREDEALIVVLDYLELETVGMHGKRETLSVTDAMADLVEYVIGQKRCEICQEEDDAVACQSEGAPAIGIDIKYPKEGPLSLFTHGEKEYLMARLRVALSEGLCALLIRHFSGGN